MKQEFFDFVHPRHFDAFVEAAMAFNCHLLVRETGRAALKWCGMTGYTGKRADMKAKTALRNSGTYQLEGLVVSPLVHPTVCKPRAMECWQQSRHLVTIPPAGFDDDVQPRGCPTPYLLQTNPRHRHYGCVAWVEMGLLTPRYVHGDYDLYAIIPAGRPFDPAGQAVRSMPLGQTMSPPSGLTLSQRVQRESLLRAHALTDQVGPLSFQVANFLNLRIARVEPGLAGALMVNHGEQVNLGAAGRDFAKVLAVMPTPRLGEHALVLHDQREHEAFYRTT